MKLKFIHLLSSCVATRVVYELTGPLCTRYALRKAGEIAIEST